MSESLLLCNGRIHPLDGSDRTHDSIALSAGKIVALGSLEECANALESVDRKIDLEEKTVLPGFHDPLGRIFREASARAFIDLSELRGLPEIFGTIETIAKDLPHGEWVRGYGWSKGQWGWARFPHRGDLDLVSPHHPVVLYSQDDRVAWLNSEATKRLGINAQTPDPPGGIIERDPATRAATGILKENAVESVLKNLPSLDWKSLEPNLHSVLEDYLRMGVVSVGSSDGDEECRFLMDQGEDSSNSPRVVCHPSFGMSEELLGNGYRTGSRFGRVELGGLRIHVDGTLVSQTAWTREPYGEDWNEFGVKILSDADLRERIAWCYRHSFAPILYASGDAACATTLQILSELDGVRGKMRPILVNADLLDKECSREAARLEVRIATNPRRIETDREVGRMYWGSRWERALNLRGWKDSGVEVVFGSGESLSGWSPLAALKTALSSSEGTNAGRELSALEGLRALTTSWSEETTDSEEPGLKVGKVADLIILDADPFEVPVEELDRIRVVSTILEGQVVFDLEESDVLKDS